MVDKKAVESKYIYEVKEQYPDFPDGKIRDFESPDFLIEDGAKTVGLEVTRYYRKQPDRDINNREIEAYQDIILSKAQELFQKENKTPLLVSPSWMFKHKLTRNEINLLANTLVDIINNNIPEDTRKPNIIYHRDLVTTLLANYCSRISIMKLEKAPRWVSFGAGFTYVEISEIQNIISEKALKILQYTTYCKEIWLIIVCEGLKISSTVDVHDVINHTFISRFDCVLLYDRDKTSAYLLSTTTVV